MRSAPQQIAHLLGQPNAVADSDKIEILRRAVKEQVTHTTAHGIARAVKRIGSFADGMEDRLVEQRHNLVYGS